MADHDLISQPPFEAAPDEAAPDEAAQRHGHAAAGAAAGAGTSPLDPNSDLGFGRVLSEQRNLRLLNRDGSFNVQRRGRGAKALLSYSNLVTTSWSRFLLLVILGYVALNALFAALFVMAGPETLVSTVDTHISSPFVRAFFFSIHTSATIGYGDLVPVGLLANVLVAIEAVVSLLGLAVVTGLVFARFSRPVADILFSKNAVISRSGDRGSFMFRIVNKRNNQIIDLRARVQFARFELTPTGNPVRRFYSLHLEREQVNFFPLSWTIVHPIDEQSPLYGITQAQLQESGAEFLVLLTGTDETFSQTVHARSSYSADEVICNAKFADIFVYDPNGRTTGVDLARFHEVVHVDRAGVEQHVPALKA